MLSMEEPTKALLKREFGIIKRLFTAEMFAVLLRNLQVVACKSSANCGGHEGAAIKSPKSKFWIQIE